MRNYCGPILVRDAGCGVNLKGRNIDGDYGANVRSISGIIIKATLSRVITVMAVPVSIGAVQCGFSVFDAAFNLVRDFAGRCIAMAVNPSVAASFTGLAAFAILFCRDADRVADLEHRKAAQPSIPAQVKSAIASLNPNSPAAIKSSRDGP